MEKRSPFPVVWKEEILCGTFSAGEHRQKEVEEASSKEVPKQEEEGQKDGEKVEGN